MSVNNFGSRLKGRIRGARLVHTTAVSIITTLTVCAADSGCATANTMIANVVTHYLSPAPSTWMDEIPSTPFNDRFNGQTPASFSDRFDGERAPFVRDFIMSSASRALLPRLALATPLTTGSIAPSAPTMPLIVASLPRPRPYRYQKIIAAGKTIVGIASTYNPTDPTDLDAGNEELASGERYDPNGWTAAIRTDLRKKFGGVRFGRNYRPAYALVQANDKQLVVKINDVGPLKPGRIIDLNKRAMSYFDPTLQLGLIGKVKVTPLADRAWVLGPVIDDRPVSVASRSVR
jgi:rare lipoprotein A